MCLREPFDEDLESSICSTVVVFCSGFICMVGVRLASAQRQYFWPQLPNCLSHLRGEVLIRVLILCQYQSFSSEQQQSSLGFVYFFALPSGHSQCTPLLPVGLSQPLRAQLSHIAALAQQGVVLLLRCSLRPGLRLRISCLPGCAERKGTGSLLDGRAVQGLVLSFLLREFVVW